MKKHLFILISLIGVFPLKAQIFVDQSNIGTSTTRSLVDNLQTCIQTIKAGSSGLLVTVEVDIETQDCPYPIICSILEGGPSGSILASESISFPVNSEREIREFNFSNPTHFDIGQTYAIALSANCISGPGHSIWWYKSVTNAYSNGQAYNQWGSGIQPEDTLNDFYFKTYLEGTEGLNIISESKPDLHSNPLNGQISLKISEANAYITIMSITGQLIQNTSIENGEVNLNVSDLTPGIYLLTASTNSRKYVKKFIKQ
jgi:hypothetical protein